MAWIPGAIGVGLQVAGTIADIANQSIVNANNREQLNIQQQLAASQIAAIKTQMESYSQLNDPVKRFEQATRAGYGAESAALLAGRPTPHMIGGVAVGPMLQRTQDGLRSVSLGYQGFQAGGKTRPNSKYSLTKSWVEAQSRRPGSFSSSVFSNSTGSTRVSGSTRSSTSAMIVSDARPVVFRPGTTAATWLPGSDA